MKMMWASDLGRAGQARGRPNAELARYVKMEYGEAEADWLLARVRAERHPSPGSRFWARLRQRLTRQRRSGRRGSQNPVDFPGAPQPKAAASASASREAAPPKEPEGQRLPIECRHANWESVGSGGNASYLRCRECDVLVVSQGGRLWSFGGAPSQ